MMKEKYWATGSSVKKLANNVNDKIEGKNLFRKLFWENSKVKFQSKDGVQSGKRLASFVIRHFVTRLRH